MGFWYFLDFFGMILVGLAVAVSTIQMLNSVFSSCHSFVFLKSWMDFWDDFLGGGLVR